MKKTIKTITILTGIFFSSLCWANLPEGAYGGISNYHFRQTPLTPDYVKMFPSFIHGLIQKSEAIFDAANNNSCADKTEVESVDHLTSARNAVALNFESSFMRVEVTKCFENTTAEKVLSALSTTSFKAKAYSTVMSVVAKSNNVTCEKSKVPLLGKSHYCYENFLDKSDSEYLKLFSINDWYELTTEYTVPVFYRETLIAAREVGSRVQIHSISYARGPDLTSVQKFFAKSFIAKTQDAFFIKLAEEIQK